MAADPREPPGQREAPHRRLSSRTAARGGRHAPGEGCDARGAPGMLMQMCRAVAAAPAGIEPTRKYRRQQQRALSLLAAASALLLQTTGARGDESSADKPPQDPSTVCLEAHRESQRLMRSDALIEAKHAMATCAARSCPALVQTDCAGWLTEVDREIPSVVLRVRVDGIERYDATVKMNGADVADALGKPLALNPGRYEFEFHEVGFAPQSRTVQVAHREKYKFVAVDFTTPRESPSQTRPLANATPIPIAPKRPVPMMTWILGGVGIAGLGGFAALAATTVSRENSLRSSCAPECDEQDTKQLKVRYLAADISLGVGAAAIVGATVFYIARPVAQSDKGGLALGLRPIRGGASAVIEGYGF